MGLPSYFSRKAGIERARELEALALALELEVGPEVTLQLEWALEMIRSSFDECDFTGSCSQEEAVRIVANQCWGFVVGARGLSGLVWRGHIADATEISSSEALEAKTAAPTQAHLDVRCVESVTGYRCGFDHLTASIVKTTHLVHCGS